MPAQEVDAFEVAVRALGAHDRTAAELDERLERRGIPAAEREEALERLGRLGYLDDERVARTRAEQLAARGSGDALIRDDLERRGVDAERIESALAQLGPERERAARIVEARGIGPRTARYLASRGFGGETIAALVAPEE
jgi:SOS response regulatory protein OraA/RecX